MHRNYRRKLAKHNPRKEGKGWRRTPPSLIPYRKAYWQKHRAKVRELMAHGRYDDIQDRHPPTIWWDIY